MKWKIILRQKTDLHFFFHWVLKGLLIGNYNSINQVNKVIISLDTDAKSEIFKISDIFKKYNIDVYIVNLKEKDPSEEGFVNMVNLIKDSKIIDLKNQILMRLEKI